MAGVGKATNELRRPRLYLAGPLFTTAERNFNLQLAALLREKYEVWLPQEHEQREKTAKEVFLKDVEGIEWADYVVASMDGADPDSGTCWECGFAHGRDIPVIAYRTDFRAAEEAGKGAYNLMLSQSAEEEITCPYMEVEELARAISESIERLKLQRGARESPRERRAAPVESL